MHIGEVVEGVHSSKYKKLLVDPIFVFAYRASMPKSADDFGIYLLFCLFIYIYIYIYIHRYIYIHIVICSAIVRGVSE